MPIALFAYTAILLVFFVYGLKLACAMGPYVQSLMGLIWTDPMIRTRKAVTKRVKELCVDGDIPDETSILMAAQELNMTEEHIRDALDGLSPQTIKAMAKGDYLSTFLKASMKASKKIKGG